MSLTVEEVWKRLNDSDESVEIEVDAVEGEDGEEGVCAPHTSATLLYDQTMYQRRNRQPGEEGSIFDRVPGPESVPSLRLIRPVAAHKEPDT